MDTNHITKEYTDGEITVIWQSSKYIHSGNCVHNLSVVFQPKTQAWIKMKNASTEQIIDAVSTCPTAALSIKEHE
jgi:uncharacterized Fe-S cluster protein YjdI